MNDYNVFLKTDLSNDGFLVLPCIALYDGFRPASTTLAYIA